MNNSRKQAFNRFKELKQQKIGNTTIITPNVKPNPPKIRKRTDELYADLQERTYELIEDKMIDLSKWSGEGSVFKYAGLID
jgi:hypothetical protein